MNFLDVSQNRYTTKKYNPSKRVSADEINQLMEIVRLSPSSINSQPWRFIFVSSEEIKSQLAEVSFFNKDKINDASHLVVFCAYDDVNMFEHQIQENLPEGAVGYYNQFIKTLPEHEIKAWFQHQVYLSLGFFLGACASMSIDSTPMEGIDSKEYNTILNLNGRTALFAVALGYRDEHDANQPALKSKSRLKLEEVVESI